MNWGSNIVSKITRIAAEQIGQSFLSTSMAQGIKGNHILMYHGISSSRNTVFNKRHIYYKDFEKQLQFIKKNFAVISVRDFFDGNYDAGQVNFALTFDDGYLNNYTCALPLLEQYQIPASFFLSGLNELGDNMLWGDLVNIASELTSKDIVIEGEKFRKRKRVYVSASTGASIYHIIRYEKADYAYKQKVKEAFAKVINIEKNQAIREFWQLMSDKEIKEVSACKFIEIGCHGYYHNNLGSLPLKNACDELVKGKKYLEGLSGKNVRQLAYPDGSYTFELAQEAYKLGFDIQLGADSLIFNAKDCSDYLKGRQGVYAIDSSLNQLFSALNS